MLLGTPLTHKESMVSIPHALPVKKKVQPLHSAQLGHDTPLSVTPKFLHGVRRRTHTKKYATDITGLKSIALCLSQSLQLSKPQVASVLSVGVRRLRLIKKSSVIAPLRKSSNFRCHRGPRLGKARAVEQKVFHRLRCSAFTLLAGVRQCFMPPRFGGLGGGGASSLAPPEKILGGASPPKTTVV